MFNKEIEGAIFDLKTKKIDSVKLYQNGRYKPKLHCGVLSWDIKLETS